MQDSSIAPSARTTSPPKLRLSVPPSAHHLHSAHPEEGRTMLKNRSKPPGTVIPELDYPDVATAAAWLCAAFGFAERLRIANHRFQLTIGSGSIVVVERHEESVPGTGRSRWSAWKALTSTAGAPRNMARRFFVLPRRTYMASGNTPPDRAGTCGGSRNRWPTFTRLGRRAHRRR